MAKATRQYVCQQCGYVLAKPMGRCPECGEWDSFQEVVSAAELGHTDNFNARTGSVVIPLPLSEVPQEGCVRISTGIKELDQVLGGGLVPGSMVLMAGEPGIGKSTLALQVLARLAEAGRRVLYVSAEESGSQLKLRAQRLELPVPEQLLVLAEINLETILQGALQAMPDVFVLDSIQAVYDPVLESSPSTLSQVRQCGNRLAQYAKRTGAVVILIGHVTKAGAIAGPKVLEHVVDVVLYFEGERASAHRMLRSMKNRYGSTEELGLFEMTETGMQEVVDPSSIFLSDRQQQVSGSVVTCAMEGSRPLLVEIQALTATSWAGSGRRLMTGIDSGRGALMVAVLEKRVGLSLADQDVYINVAGGLKVTEPASDLAVSVAMASSYREAPVVNTLMAVGEVGLGGEVRPVPRLSRRLSEAARLGFEQAILPAAALSKQLQGDYPSLELIGVATVEAALNAAANV